MNVTRTEIPGLLIIEPKVFADDRGFFLEIFHAARFREAGLPDAFVQDNLSRSKRGVVRGLHYQEPDAQGKLVRCTRGSLFDVAVDIRVGSPTFGRWFGMELSEKDMRMVWVPEGFAHGFCALTDDADLVYKCTAPYVPEHDRSILWNDPEIGIAWPVSSPSLSPKDAAAPPLKQASPLPRFRRS